MEVFIGLCKKFIEQDDLENLQEFYMENLEEEYPWEYIYQKLYLHACLKKKVKIVEWLQGLFSLFDPIQQIAIRQMFFYGKYLLNK
jgi:hypothetical protein